MHAESMFMCSWLMKAINTRKKICIHKYGYIYIHTYIYICIYTHAETHTSVCACMQHMFMCLFVDENHYTRSMSCTWEHAHIHTHLHVCRKFVRVRPGATCCIAYGAAIHTHICIHIHTYIHTYVQEIREDKSRRDMLYRESNRYIQLPPGMYTHKKVCNHTLIFTHTNYYYDLHTQPTPTLLTVAGGYVFLMYVCTYACMYVCVNLCMHVCMYILYV